MENQVTPTQENVYCGVVIVNAVLGGLNILLATWFAHDRRKSDVHRRNAHTQVMRRLDHIEDKCPLVQVPELPEGEQ